MALDVNLDGVRAGSLGDVIEVAAGTYQVTVGDPEDLTSDGRPIVRMGDQTFVSRPATVEVVLDDDRLREHVVLDVHVDTTLPCLVSLGYYWGAECDGDDRRVVTSEEVVEVSFRVEGRELVVSPLPDQLFFNTLGEVEGSSPEFGDNLTSADPFTNEAIELRVEGPGDCASFAWWECPPPE